MKTIQQRLQRRISKRSADITRFEGYRTEALSDHDYSATGAFNALLKRLREEQVLDKNILSSVYWNNV